MSFLCASGMLSAVVIVRLSVPRGEVPSEVRCVALVLTVLCPCLNVLYCVLLIRLNLWLTGARCLLVPLLCRRSWHLVCEANTWQGLAALCAIRLLTSMLTQVLLWCGD